MSSATPSISAEEYRKHAQQGTLDQLLDDKNSSEASDPPDPDPSPTPAPDADSDATLGLMKAGYVRKTLIKQFDVNPVGKPRQTRSDKWKKRPCVVRYRDFCDEVRYQADSWSIPESGLHIVFHVEAPKTKQERAGDPHHLKPDVDNLLKALFDALEDEDKYIWDVRATARWCKMGEGHIDVYSVHQTESLS